MRLPNVRVIVGVPVKVAGAKDKRIDAESVSQASVLPFNAL
jgi:hypothetical protein